MTQGQQQIDRLVVDDSWPTSPRAAVGTIRERRQARRDSQKAKVYAWEQSAYPNSRDDRMTKDETRELVHRVHRDIHAVGGFVTAGRPSIRFTLRKLAGSASFDRLAFNPAQTSTPVVLHEIAHSVTFYPDWLVGVARLLSVTPTGRRRIKRLPTYERHILISSDPQGHGPRFVACFIALMECYAGFDADKAVQSTRSFEYERKGQTKTGRVRVDDDALAYWRDLLRRKGSAAALSMTGHFGLTPPCPDENVWPERMSDRLSPWRAASEGVSTVKRLLAVDTNDKRVRSLTLAEAEGADGL